MNAQPKNKILIIIIGILLIANIVTLSFFLINRNDHSKSGRNDKNSQLTSFLKKEVGFSEGQINQYDTLSKQHRSGVRQNFDEMAIERENIFKKLASQAFSDTAIIEAANSISEQQKKFEIKMLLHLKEIRNICTTSQKLIFDSGFYKIIGKRGDGRMNK